LLAAVEEKKMNYFEIHGPMFLVIYAVFFVLAIIEQIWLTPRR